MLAWRVRFVMTGLSVILAAREIGVTSNTKEVTYGI
jgi:hypothetical protein